MVNELPTNTSMEHLHVGNIADRVSVAANHTIPTAATVHLKHLSGETTGTCMKRYRKCIVCLWA